MDAVKSFNNELSSLYDVKPPISKAKMTALTRGAIKAIKFYKHVVQSVEKFILKCKPEYKVPGLYVIDSIVRQSRHQFGTDKDVFAPRFAKNIQQTFINLFRCPPEDKSKVIRVLNLWQKNQVFAPEVIQPLFDLADPNHPIHREQAALASNGLAGQNLLNKSSPANQKTPTKKSDGNLWQNTTQLDATNALAHLGVASLAANPNALLQLSGQSMDPSMLVQLQALQRLLLKQSTDTSGSKSDGGQVHFDRKLLDFDYGSDEEDDHANPSPKAAPASSGIDTVGSLLANPEVMRQLQTLQQQLSQQQQIEMEEKLRKLQEMKQQEEEFDKHLAQTVPNLPFAAECDLKPVSHTNSPANLYKHEPAYVLPSNFDLSQPPPGYKMYGDQAGSQDDTLESEVEFIDNHDNGEVINLDHSDSRSPSPDDRYSRRRRSRSRDRSRGRDRDRDRRSRRSRSRSRSRSRRRRSRSRERERDREKDKEKEKDREKDRERRKRGLPPIKKENLSVCSTTLWVGHLSKLVHQEDLSDTFGEFGDIVSIDLIPPRGCAFIVMNRRQDAARCLSKLKNHKMQGKAITLAWAPGKGVKGKDFKDYWEVELGVSYIPWSKIKPDTDIELLEEGGMIDEDTMPEWLRAKQAETQPKPIMKPAVLDPNESSMLEKPGFIPLPDGTPVASTGTPTTGVDTSQPPPLHANNLLPPPMAMPIVSPFSLNTRLLGPMGHMSLPPGMMPNVPIGVPPPNLPGGPLLPNQLLGIGSPFGQGMPGMPQMSQMPMAANQENKAGPGLLPPGVPNVTENIPESVMGVPPHSFTAISMGSHNDDNMDIEMEDAEKPEKQMPLSDQLLASIGGGGFNNPPNNSTPNLGIAAGRFGGNIPPLMPPTDIDERHGPSNRDSRDNRDSRTRDRNDRDRDRDRDRSRRSSRDRGRDRDLGRNDRRERNRWSDRDRRDRDRNDRDDKKSEQPPPRNEKSLAERLREMAHEGVVPNRDRPPRDRNDDQHQSFEPPIDRSGFPTFPNGEPHHPERMDRNRTERDRMDHDRHDHGRGDRARLDNERMERDHERTDMGWRDRRGQDMFRDGSHVAPPGVPHAGPPRAGPPSGPRVGPPSGPPNVPPGGPPVVPHGGPPGGPPGGPHGGPPSVPHGGPPGGAHGGPPPAPHGGPPGGPHSGPPGGPPNGPHGGPPGGSHGGHPGGPHGGHQAGIHGGLPIVLHGGPPGGPHGPPSGPHGPPSGHHSGPPGGHHGPPSGHHGGPPGVPPGEHSDDFHGEEFKPRMRRHPDEFPMDHSEHDPRIPHHGDFDPRIANPDMEHRRPPMMHHDEIPPGMEHERFEFGMRGGRDGFDRRDFGRRGPDDMRMMDEYDHRMRGPDFHPREGFGPRMRGPGPDGFPPRPLLGRPPGPHMFHARGPPMRGPRPGPWMENIRPNFPPRFEGPGPDFHNRMPFDEHHPRHRRYDDRRRFRSEDNPPEHERFDRRSRWSNNSPNKTEEMIPADCTSTEATDVKEIFKESNKDVLQVKDDNMKTDMKVSKEMETKPRVGGTTPLRDEPQDTHATEPHVQNDAPPPPGTETKEETETKESVAAEETA